MREVPDPRRPITDEDLAPGKEEAVPGQLPFYAAGKWMSVLFAGFCFFLSEAELL